MIPKIEIYTNSIKAKYNVSEDFAHKIIKLILQEYELELNSSTTKTSEKVKNDRKRS